MSALAITSFVFSLMCALGALPAVIIGIIALPRIRKRNQDGRGFAIAGIAIGGIFLALMLTSAVVVFISGAVVEKDGTQRSSSDACRTEARTIRTASEAFYAQNTRYPLTMDELVESNMLNQASDLYDLEPNNQAMPDLVPIDGACGGVTIPGN